jgi:hypothetical protein
MTKTITFVDDQIPVEPGGDIGIIDNTKLIELLELSTEDWYSQVSLKSLIEKVIATERYQDHHIIINAVTHPSILLNEILEKGYDPDVIVYDWEYETQSHESGENLLEILKSTKAFAFVYSSFFDAIPPTLNKNVFNDFVNRIQLLSKGDKQSSIFSSEEFIVQYILGLFEKNNVIELSNHKVSFNSSGYLENASDILYLESVLGKGFILRNLEKIKYEISGSNIENLFDLVTDKLFVADANELMKDRYGPLTEMSYKDVLKKVGVKGLDELLNGGIIPIK